LTHLIVVIIMRLSILPILACVLVGCMAARAVLAQQPSGRVDHIPLLPDGVKLSSFAGYITVNEKLGSNIFYWLFEAQDVDPSTAPLLLWFNGGPGSSSMYGLFSEHGPFAVSPDGSKLVMRETSWTKKYNVAYIDNPVGTGMSYTKSKDGFVTDENEVGRDLLNFLYKFYEMYPQYQKLPLYITGESYAGKYVPAFAYAVHQANEAYISYAVQHPDHAERARQQHRVGVATFRDPAPHNVPNGMPFPLTGIVIGDGMMDPQTQIPGYGELLYNFGMITAEQRDYMISVEQKVLQLANEGKRVEAFHVFDALMMSDIYPAPSFFNNATGLTDYFNFLSPDYPANDFTTYLNRADVKAALHVDPSYVYVSGNETVEEYLLDDWMRSVKDKLVVLLENYRTMIYSGQNDIILSAAACQNFLNQLQWKGGDAWHRAPHQIWKLHEKNANPAGYVKQGASLTYAVVRDAGHLLPQDQPERALDLITRFIDNKPFTQ